MQMQKMFRFTSKQHFDAIFQIIQEHSITGHLKRIYILVYLGYVK